VPQEPTRDELFKLYQVAIDEYRFEVKLNSDRSTHYVVFNSAVLTAATGLLKIGESSHLNPFVALVFGIGVCTSWLGARSIRKGNEYYHRAIYKKTLLEEILGLTAIVKDYPTATLAIGTTAGQADINTILRDPSAWLAAETPKRGSITHATIIVLRLLLAANIAGILATIYLMTNTAPYIPWP
jgi:hypothetical protein